MNFLRISFTVNLLSRIVSTFVVWRSKLTMVLEGCKKTISLRDVIIDKQNALQYSFKEELLLVNKECKKLGEVKINVAISQLTNDYFEFNIHTSSRSETAELGVYGMSVTSRVKSNFMTIEEKRREYSSLPEKYEQHLYVAKIQRNYYISSVMINNNVISRQRAYDVCREDLYNFLSEGANIILLRTLALRKLLGKLKTRTVIIQGYICKSALIVTHEDLILFNKTFKTIKVTRVVKIDVSDITTKMYIWLNYSGQILLHKWEGSDSSLQIDPRIEICTKLYNIPLERDWYNDLQLSAIYIDKISKLKSNYMTYMADYPEISQLISDFVFHVLLERPDDVYQFAIDFFTRIY